MGPWCGYVGVPPGHPWHGADARSLDVWIHGGLNYSASCDVDMPIEDGICHVPAPGRPGDVWWLGFDCGHWCDGHWCDGSPAMDALLARIAPELDIEYRKLMDSLGIDAPRTGIYRTVSYVRAEVERLARQVYRAR